MAGNIGVNASPKTYKSWANGYMALVDTAFKKGKDFTSNIFYKDTTENYEDRIVEIGGIDDYEVWADGQRAAQSEIEEGFAKTFVQVPFGREVPIGRLFKKFQGKDVNITRRASTRLGANAYRQMQRAPFSLIGNGFSDTNSYLTNITGSSVSALLPDGKRLFSTVHPLSPTNSATYSNADSQGRPVGEEGLEALLQLLFDQKDDKGEAKHYGNDGVIWMVPREQFAEAKRTISGELRSGTADNDMNQFNNPKTADGYYNGSQVELRLVPWLSEFSTTGHYVIAKEVVEEEMPLVMLTSESFHTDDYVDDATKTVYIRGQMIYSVGAVSGRGLAGSKGDNASYTS